VSDPNVYQGPAGGGIHHPLVNAAAGGPGQADNTGATDVTATFTAQLATLQASGQTQWLPAGTYGIKPVAATGVSIGPSGASLRGDPEALLVAAVPAGDGHTDSPFFATWQSRVTGVTTLNGNSVEGSRTVVVHSVAGLPVGGYVVLDINLNPGLSYLQTGVGATGTADLTAGGLYGGGGTLNGTTLILNVAGAGALTLNLAGAGNAASEAALIAAIRAEWPALTIAGQGPGLTGKNLVLTGPSLVVGAGSANAFLGLSVTNNTIELDIPVEIVVPDTTPVDTFVPTTGVHLDGNGATLSGTGGRAWWLLACWGANVENWTVESSFTYFGPDFDEAGRNNTFRRIKAVNVGGSNIGFAFEGGQGHLAELCEAQGFPVNFSAGGIAHTFRNCSGARGSVGVALQNQGTGDVCCARSCTIEGGAFDGNGTFGLAILDNSIYNIASDGHSDYNATAGVWLSTDPIIAATTGASWNTIANWTAVGNGFYGFRVGSAGATLPHDGNKFIGCQALGTVSGDGFSAYTGATNTLYSGCLSKGNSARGYVVFDATTIGTSYSGCDSEGNSTGWLLGNDAVLTNCNSSNDTTIAVQSSGAGAIVINAGKWIGVATGGGWTGYKCGSSGASSLSRMVITSNSDGTTIFASALIQAAGTVTMDDVTATGMNAVIQISAGVLYLSNVRSTGGAGTTYGIYDTGGTIHIGPGCSFTGFTHPINFGGGVFTMAQTGGVASFPGGTTTTTMTFAQHYALSIEIGSTTPIAAGAQTINPLGSFIGQEFTVVNNNTAASTTTVFGIVVPVAARYLIRCNAAGVWEHDVVT